jgi:transcriptional regulator with XRE-family HTH domain
VARVQIALFAEDQKRVRARAAELGIWFAEYVRRLLARAWAARQDGPTIPARSTDLTPGILGDALSAIIHAMPAWALLREARARANLSQRALAARADTAQSEIARIENGRQEPSHATLERIIRAAGFDVRIELVPHDDHDERLIDAMLALPAEERLDTLEEQSEFYASAKEIQ